MYTLFPDQQKVLYELRRSIAAGNKSVLLQAATGFGKTVIAATMIANAHSKGRKTWFIMPRKELVRQTSLTYKEAGLTHGYIASGHGYNNHEQHHIVMDKTLVRKLDKVDPPDLAFIDETHYGGAGLDKIIKWLKEKGVYIIGMSATPWRLNGKGLGDWYDDMVCGPSNRWLIDNHRLSSYKLFTAPVGDLSVKVTGGDYNKAALEQAVFEDRARIGNAVKSYIEHCMGFRTVVFGVSIADCERIAEEFNASGIKAAVISGKTPDDERKKLISEFADGDLVLVSCELLTFGFDLAAQVGRNVTVEAMIDMAPTLSLAKQMQKWGRVLRVKPMPAIICDHAGNVFEHDKPCAAREWTLEDRKKKGKSSGEPKEKTILLRQCLMCGYTFKPAPKCPKCGEPVPIKERTVDEVESGLVEVDIETFKKQQRQQVGRARTMDDLWRIAKERGYKHGWVYKQSKLKGIS